MFRLRGSQNWSQFVQQNLPRAVDGLFRKMRVFTRNTFSSSCEAFASQLNEQHTTSGSYAKASFKRLYKGNVQFAKEDCINSHESPLLEAEKLRQLVAFCPGLKPYVRKFFCDSRYPLRTS